MVMILVIVPLSRLFYKFMISLLELCFLVFKLVIVLISPLHGINGLVSILSFFLLKLSAYVYNIICKIKIRLSSTGNFHSAKGVNRCTTFVLFFLYIYFIYTLMLE